MNKNSIAMQALSAVESLKEKDFTHCSMTDRSAKCCFVGHIHRLNSKDTKDYEFMSADVIAHSGRFQAAFLNKFFDSYVKFFETKHKIPVGKYDLFMINDSAGNKYYPGKTPRKRIISLLTDMIEAGY